jgi:hypothetical protein
MAPSSDENELTVEIFRNQLGAPALPGRMSISRPLAVTALVLLTGCAAQRPVLYPTERLVQVDPTVSERDVNDCQHLASSNVRSTLPEDTLRETAIGGGIGAATGAVGGAIFGSPGSGAAFGAATGATANLLNSLLRSNAPTPTYQNYVATCLSDRGYRVVGWQ